MDDWQKDPVEKVPEDSDISVEAKTTAGEAGLPSNAETQRADAEAEADPETVSAAAGEKEDGRGASAVSPSARRVNRQKSSMTWMQTAYDLVDNLIAVLLVLTVIFVFFFRMVGVDGSSMNDTLTHQDRLVLQTAFYTPKRGDIVVLYQDTEPEKPLIKRVIATGGDSLRLDVENNAVYLKQAGTEEWVQLDESAYVHYPLAWGINWSETDEVTVPEGYLFVMGDHRNNSRDSRYESIGFVSVDNVIGHAILRVFPLDKFGVL